MDGYHAPSRNPGNQFPSAKAAAWTLDAIESPRNSGWFLCAVAARRALTFLEQQPEVDPDRLGVYGHSMGGKLTVMTAPDQRVKAAAPSCGGISDRGNASGLFRATLGDDVSLRKIECPIVFLSPSNDFHGHVGDLASAVNEIGSSQWRVTSAPHHNHQDTAGYEVATLLWFDQHLKGIFRWPATPTPQVQLKTPSGVPTVSVSPDPTLPITSIDFYYTQHGRPNEANADRENTVHRFWRHAPAVQEDGIWSGELPLASTDDPLWVYANVTYRLPEPVTGAGYYYRRYVTDQFHLSSLLTTVTTEQLQTAQVRATANATGQIEEFQGDWEKEWFTYRPEEWARSTHKLYDRQYRAPHGAQLVLEVLAEAKNTLVLQIDDHATEVQLTGNGQWQRVVLSPSDLHDLAGNELKDWSAAKRLTLAPNAQLRPRRGQTAKARMIGTTWQGPPPRFRNLSWVTKPAAK